MSEPQSPPGMDSEEAIRSYKTVLANVIERRPSGTRQRLADSLGKNRSFVTQITSPAYSVPIPARHIDAIMAVCHFSPAERDQFLAAYAIAHPGKVPIGAGLRRMRHLVLSVPDLGDDKQNAALDRAITEFVQRIASLSGGEG